MTLINALSPIITCEIFHPHISLGLFLWNKREKDIMMTSNYEIHLPVYNLLLFNYIDTYLPLNVLCILFLSQDPQYLSLFYFHVFLLSPLAISVMPTTPKFHVLYLFAIPILPLLSSLLKSYLSSFLHYLVSWIRYL